MKRFVVAALVALAVAVVAGPAAAHRPQQASQTIQLPNGFQPEGLVTGYGTLFYTGSTSTGAIYRGDARSGRGSVLVPPQAGRSALGLALDRRGRLWVAGGATGQAYVYDARTGGQIATYQLAPAGSSFVNDVIVTRDGAYFTDSNLPALYRVPLSPDGDPAPAAQAIPLTGDIVYGPGFNANGIDATPDGRTLVVAQTNTGRLFRVDPRTGVARAIAGVSVPNVDGILLAGKTLFAAENFSNQVAVVRLAHGLSAGAVVDTITDPSFDVPTGIDSVGDRLLVVDARFTTPPTPTTPYWITVVAGQSHGDDG